MVRGNGRVDAEGYRRWVPQVGSTPIRSGDTVVVPPRACAGATNLTGRDTDSLQHLDFIDSHQVILSVGDSANIAIATAALHAY